MRAFAKFLKECASKLSYTVKCSIKVFGRLIGIKETEGEEGNEYDTTGLSKAVWIFAVGVPIGLFTLGVSFSLYLWALVVFGLLAIVNLDEALELTVNYTENK